MINHSLSRTKVEPIKTLKIMKTNPISFRELSDYKDSNSCVILALLINDESEVDAINGFLANKLGFSNGKKIIGYHHIEGNVRGRDGRSDYLLEFDHPEVAFNPIARLRFPDIKWTSDFKDNFSEDYTLC